MKKIILILMMLFICMYAETGKTPAKHPYVITENLVLIQNNRIILKRDFDKLIKAISWVESRYKLKAYNEHSHALGHLQILKIVIKDLNKQGYHFKYTDRLDSLKSINIFMAYNKIYNPTFDRDTAILLWYTGPSLYKKGYGKEYYKLVMKQLKN